MLKNAEEKNEIDKGEVKGKRSDIKITVCSIL